MWGGEAQNEVRITMAFLLKILTTHYTLPYRHIQVNEHHRLECEIAEQTLSSVPPAVV